MKLTTNNEIESDLQSIHAEFSATSLTFPEGTTVSEWAKIGQKLYRGGQVLSWWMADWAAFGERKYGELKEFCDLNGFNYGTMRTYGLVARSVELSSRLDNVAFAHHQEVASLQPREQRYWLTRAENEKIPVPKLRSLIRHSQGEFSPEKTACGDGDIFGFDKLFLNADAVISRKQAELVERRDYLIPLALPMLRKLAAAWPDVIEIKT